MRQKLFTAQHPEEKKVPKYMVKLTESGKLDDLNKLLDAMATSLQGTPK
jgi:hypothetical protein